MRGLAWNIVGRPVQLKFDVNRLKAVSGFSAGMTAVAVSSMIVMQVDKLMLSRMLTLADFGKYTLAWTVASGLALIITPFFNALYPRFSALVSQQRVQELWGLYSTSTAFLCSVIFPVAAAAAIFAKPALLVWTRNEPLSIAAAPVIGVVILGTAVNGVMHMPYALQLAYGMVRLPLYTSIAMALMVVPLILALTPKWGTVGAASAWLILNLVYFVLGTLLTHRYLFKKLAFQWVFRDVSKPAIITAFVMAAAWKIGTSPVAASPLLALLIAAFLTLFCICLNVLSYPQLRAYLGANLHSRASA
jgi:O-antigen/teichoic acid export membrane protein